MPWVLPWAVVSMDGMSRARLGSRIRSARDCGQRPVAAGFVGAQHGPLYCGCNAQASAAGHIQCFQLCVHESGDTGSNRHCDVIGWTEMVADGFPGGADQPPAGAMAAGAFG